MTVRRYLGGLAAVVLALGFMAAGPAAAESHAHHHGSGHGKAGLTLDDGNKWSGDAVLQQGMERIRGAMAAALSAIHAGKFPAAAYGKLGRSVSEEVGVIVAGCKLEPRADAQLHLIIARLMEGAEAMARKGGSRRVGAAKVVSALADYAAYFDHPGWVPLAP